MCAAEATNALLRVRIPLQNDLSPTAIVKKEMYALFQKNKIEIKHTPQQQRGFKIMWEVDEKDGSKVISRTVNSLVVRVGYTKEQKEEEGFVAKIFFSTITKNQTGKSTYGLEDLSGIKEYTTLMYLNNHGVPNIPSIQGASWDSVNHITILIFKNLGQSLHNKIRLQQTPLPIHKISQMTIHILSTLTEMGKLAPNCKHGDIKLLNIMEGGILIDWAGMSKGRNIDLENYMTLYIRPPEVLLRIGQVNKQLGDYGPEVDIWSLGVTIFEAATNYAFSLANAAKEEELEQMHSIYVKTGSEVPLEMQQLSPVRAKFFDEEGRLKEARAGYNAGVPLNQYLKIIKKKLIDHLPEEDPNRVPINTYYDRLEEFLTKIFIIDPKLRPNHPHKVLQLFREAGLII